MYREMARNAMGGGQSKYLGFVKLTARGRITLAMQLF